MLDLYNDGAIQKRPDSILGIGLMIVARLLFLPIPGLDPPKHSEALDCDAAEKSGFLFDIYHNETTSHNVDLLTRFMRTVGQVSADASARNVECGQGDGSAPLCAHLWCCTEPALTEYQFFAGMGVGMIGYPYCIALCQAIFSKVLGQRPQVCLSMFKINKISQSNNLLIGFVDGPTDVFRVRCTCIRSNFSDLYL